MASIFNPSDNQEIIDKINKLTPNSEIQWGKMTPQKRDTLMWKHLDHHLKQFGT